jgi:hypothetical protein
MNAALDLYRDAESRTGEPGARKRWRMAAQALALATDNPAGQAAFATANATHKRADWRIAARALAVAIDATQARPVTVKPERAPRLLSLLEFLSAAGGLQDPGGDLKAMDAHLWHRGAAFRRRLVNPAGLTLDYAADLAFERGYFDDIAPASWEAADNMHPVSADVMIQAISRELGGKMRYPNACENAPYYVEPEPEDSERLWAETYPESVDAWMEAA